MRQIEHEPVVAGQRRRVTCFAGASVLIALCAGGGSCSVVLNQDGAQCLADADCARFSNAMCDRITRLCVARPLTTITTSRDGGADAIADADGARLSGMDAVAAADGTAGLPDRPTTDVALSDGRGAETYVGPVCPDLNSNGVMDCQESLVMNGDFRTGLVGWTAELNMRQGFQSTDATGNPNSGSIAITNANQSDTTAGSTMGGSSQCIRATGLKTYDLYLQTLSASSDPSISASVIFQFYPSTDCSGSLNGSFMPTPGDENTSGWRALQSIVSVPGGSGSVLVRLVVVKPFKQPPVQALFDNVLFKAR